LWLVWKRQDSHHGRQAGSPATSPPGLASPPPHLRQDFWHTPPTSPPGLGLPPPTSAPGLTRIRAGTWRTPPPTSAPGLGSLRPQTRLPALQEDPGVLPRLMEHLFLMVSSKRAPPPEQARAGPSGRAPARTINGRKRFVGDCADEKCVLGGLAWQVKQQPPPPPNFLESKLQLEVRLETPCTMLQRAATQQHVCNTVQHGAQRTMLPLQVGRPSRLSVSAQHAAERGSRLQSAACIHWGGRSQKVARGCRMRQRAAVGCNLAGELL
jgi:hypothetical protein